MDWFTYGLLCQAALAPMVSDVPAAGYDELLTPDQTSAKVKIAKQTLARWRVEGRGPRFLRLGNRIFYRPGDLEAWLATCVFSSTSEADQAAA
jgi:hypothetical protein